MDYGRIPFIKELHIVADSARAAAELVIRVASEKVAEASLPYQGDNGDYFLMNAESVTHSAGPDAAETVVEMVRPGFTENIFFGIVDGQGDDAEPLELSAAGSRLVGGLQSLPVGGNNNMTLWISLIPKNKNGTRSGCTSDTP